MTTDTNVKDGGWCWVIVVAAFFLNFIMDGIRFSFGILYIEFYDYFGGSKGAVGCIGGIVFGLTLTAGPISGSLVNKFGCRVVTICGSLLLSAALFISVFATSVIYLCLSLGVLGGLGLSMMVMTAYLVLIQYFEKKRSLAIGLAVSGSGLGGFAFNPLVNCLLETYAWRGTLLILSGIIMNGVVCGTVMRPIQTRNNTQYPNDSETRDETLDNEQLVNIRSMNDSKDAQTDKTKAKTHFEKRYVCEIITEFRTFCSSIFMISLLKNRRFFLFVLFKIFFNVSTMVPFTYVPDMTFVKVENVTRGDVVWIMNAMSLANVISRIPIGIIADLKLISNISLISISCMVAGVSCAVMPFCQLYGLLITVCICFSISMASALVLVPVALCESFGDYVIANSFGLYLFFGGISTMLGTPLAGWLFDLKGSYELSFLLGGVEFVLAGLCLLIVPCVKPRTETLKSTPLANKK